MQTEEELKIVKLLKYFAKNTYNAATSDEMAIETLNQCISLIESDYNVIKIPNNKGNLCFQYPSMLAIIESEKQTNSAQNNSLDETKLMDLFQNAKLARCRQRFPVPVINFNGKHICRSATLASVPEVCYRSGIELNLKSLWALKEFMHPTEDVASTSDSVNQNYEEAPLSISVKDEITKNYPNCDKVRDNDIKLLREINVMKIINLMVEKRKCKYGLFVSSSEIVDMERFTDFKIVSFPYPGCEFFKKYHDKMLIGKGLKFDWSDPSCNVTPSVPDNILNIDWEGYRDWDLVVLTQNYIKYILKSLQEDTSGVLIHCISGWDRTPLFISLLRVSLWADGQIHQSLDVFEILYLTIGYDWMCFGHHLPDRLYKKEDILYFCFYMLKYIADEEYSVGVVLNGDSDLNQDNLSVVSENDNFDADICCDGENGNCNLDEVGHISPNISPILEAGSSRDIELLSDRDSSKSSPENQSIKSHSSSGNENTAKYVSLGSPITSSPRSSQRSKLSLPARTRNDSTGSTISSSSYGVVNLSGSIDSETSIWPSGIRSERLKSVRDFFINQYFKAIRGETFGPPKTVMEQTFQYLCDKLGNNYPVA